MAQVLPGKRVAITAGAAGLGLTIATSLAAEGATVFVADIDAAAVAALPPPLVGAMVDVADPVAVDTWLAPIVADGIDILVNNAGIAGPTAPVEDIALEEWRRCVAVCLDSMFFCCRRVVPTMKATGAGCIVNIASTAALMGMPLRSPYVTAKHGVVGLTKSLAMELGRSGVRVNAIAPGSLHGDRMERVIAAHAQAEDMTEAEVRRRYVEGVSMAKFIEPGEIAAMVVYLCSDAARSITGQVIAIDGHTETLYPR